MIYTIRDNEGNIVCSVENTTTIEPTVSFESINAELKDLNEYGNKLDKSIEAFNLVSDTRAMEALGYVKGAGFSKNVKAVGHEIWKRIKEFFIRIGKMFKRLWEIIKQNFNKLKEKISKNKKKTQDTLSAITQSAHNATNTKQIAEKLVTMNKSKPTNEVFLNTLKTTTIDNTQSETITTPEIEEKAIESIDEKLKRLINDPDVDAYFKIRKIRATVVRTNFDSNAIDVANYYISNGYDLLHTIDSYWNTVRNRDWSTDDAISKASAQANKFKEEFKNLLDHMGVNYHLDDDEISEKDKLKYLHIVLLDIKNDPNLNNTTSLYDRAINDLEDLADKFTNLADRILSIDNEFSKDYDVAINESVFKISNLGSTFRMLMGLFKDESIFYSKVLNLCATI